LQATPLQGFPKMSGVTLSEPQGSVGILPAHK
jgi:hypothetical protein